MNSYRPIYVPLATVEAFFTEGKDSTYLCTEHAVELADSPLFKRFERQVPYVEVDDKPCSCKICLRSKEFGVTLGREFALNPFAAWR